MKCIVCEFKARNVDEITKHYEAVHLNTKDNDVIEVAAKTTKELLTCTDK